MKPEVLVLLSGGLDSYACLHFYRDTGRIPAALFVDYGQPAASDEEAAATSIAAQLDTQISIVRWRGIVPKKAGRVNARNAFLLFAALMEASPSMSIIAVGVHGGTEYEDCSANFIDRIQSVYDIYTDGLVQVAAPFVDWSKSEIFAYLIKNELELDLSYSCEAGGVPTCGRCLSCQDKKALVSHA